MPFEMKISKRYNVYRANNKFWNQWRECKDDLKDDGIRVIKIESKWHVLVPVGFKEQAETDTESDTES